MDKLDLVAKALLKYETLDSKQFMLAYNGKLDLSDEPLSLGMTLEQEVALNVNDDGKEIKLPEDKNINVELDTIV